MALFVFDKPLGVYLEVLVDLEVRTWGEEPVQMKSRAQRSGKWIIDPVIAFGHPDPAVPEAGLQHNKC